MRVVRSFRSLSQPVTNHAARRCARQLSVPPRRLLSAVSDRFQVEVADHVFNWVVEKQVDPNRESLIFFTDGMRIYNPTLRYSMVDLEKIVDDVTGFFSYRLELAFDAVANHHRIPPDPQYFTQVLVKPRGDFRMANKVRIHGFVVYEESAFGRSAALEVAIGEMNHFFLRSIAPHLRNS